MRDIDHNLDHGLSFTDTSCMMFAAPIRCGAAATFGFMIDIDFCGLVYQGCLSRNPTFLTD